MNIRTPLYPHQLAAVDKLKDSRVGALFMEMGTGKTLTSMELARLRWDKIDRLIWICPVSVKSTINDQFLRHTDQVPFVLNKQTKAPDAKVVIVGIESIQSSSRVQVLMAELITPKTYVILDESTYIKNPKAKRTKFLLQYSKICLYRLILSGTPITRYADDLWSQCAFLHPKVMDYSNYHIFGRYHLKYDTHTVGRVVGSKNLDLLSKRISPYVYQVKKSECVTLPDKVYQTLNTCLTDEQYEHYCEIKYHFGLKLSELPEQERGGFAESALIYQLFGYLQKVVSGYSNFDPEKLEDDTEEAKDLKVFRNIKKPGVLTDAIDLIDPTQKIVIWATLRHDVKRIGEALTQEYGSDSYAVVHGGVSQADRATAFNDFKGTKRFLIITPATGSHGIDLTHASYSIFYSHSWDYATRIQAEDRLHRIGQVNKVTYINIVCEGCIDVHMCSVLGRKKNMIAEFKKCISNAKTKEDILKAMRTV
jgi:SNF2 family DNA or RNA helicase